MICEKHSVAIPGDANCPFCTIDRLTINLRCEEDAARAARQRAEAIDASRDRMAEDLSSEKTARDIESTRADAMKEQRDLVITALKRFAPGAARMIELHGIKEVMKS